MTKEQIITVLNGGILYLNEVAIPSFDPSLYAMNPYDDLARHRGARDNVRDWFHKIDMYLGKLIDSEPNTSIQGRILGIQKDLLILHQSKELDMVCPDGHVHVLLQMSHKIREAILAASGQNDQGNLGTETTQGAEESNQASFLPGQLTDLLQVDSGTLNSYAQKAGVSRPGRGQRNYHYPKEDTIKILEKMKESSEKRIIDNASRVLKSINPTDQ
jgi:hypothetical protein